MKKIAYLLLPLIIVVACKKDQKKEITVEEEPRIQDIRLDRYQVKYGNIDSIILTSYILEKYDSLENVSSSVYYTSDDLVMMQFQNSYEDGKKTKADWVNASDSLVQYVEFTYGEDGKLSRSKTFGPDGIFRSGFIHEWRENGTVEAKGDLVDTDTAEFKPNAFYHYNEMEEVVRLKEFDAQDSLIYNGTYKYTERDTLGNWIERTTTSEDTIRRMEKRIIRYKQIN